MNPGNYILSVYKGDFSHYRFTLWQDLGRTIASDLTNVVATAEIRDRPGGGDLITAMDCTITLPNQVDMILTSPKSAFLPASAYWDLQLVYPSGDTTTPLAGPVLVTGDVTDSIPAEQATVTPLRLVSITGRRR